MTLDLFQTWSHRRVPLQYHRDYLLELQTQPLEGGSLPFPLLPGRKLKLNIDYPLICLLDFRRLEWRSPHDHRIHYYPQSPNIRCESVPTLTLLLLGDQNLRGHVIWSATDRGPQIYWRLELGR